MEDCAHRNEPARQVHALLRSATPHAPPLPIMKLGQVSMPVRRRLKAQSIHTCNQLLTAAGRFEDRAALAHVAGLSLAGLTELVRRADLARVRGIGVVFSRMLGNLGVDDVATLARHEHRSLHERLREHNEAMRLARRAPTAEEVADWIDQARKLPTIVTCQSERWEAAS